MTLSTHPDTRYSPPRVPVPRYLPSIIYSKEKTFQPHASCIKRVKKAINIS